MMFGGKGGELALMEAMKKKFKIIKNPRGYAISNICDPTVKVATQILVGKVMRKCLTDEVSTPVVALAAQCAEGVQFNWVCYLCGEFLANCCKAQDLGKTFHYAWLLLSMVLVTWELPEDSKFPSVTPNLPEAVKYASLWATKDAQCIKDSKIFWILMEMNIHMVINRKLQLSPTVFAKLQECVEFKADFQRVSIRAWKDPEQQWHDLPYLATDDAIDTVLDHWPTKSRTTSNLTVGSSKSSTQRKKEGSKLKMA